MNLIDKINLILERAETFPEMLEISDDVWQALTQVAQNKGFILEDDTLRTVDGKTLVTLDTEDSWQQLMTYLELENLVDTPIRELTIDKIRQAQTHPEAIMKQVTINATMGADGILPTEQELKEILTANLKPIKGSVQGNIQVIKQNASIAVKFNVVSPQIENSEIERVLKTNLDKILQITNLEIKDLGENR